MKCVVLAFPLLLLLVSCVCGYYSSEEQLIDELEALQQGVVSARNEHQIIGAQRSDSSRSKQRSSRYNNKFDKPLSIECNRRRGESLYKVNSRYSSYNKDRQWKWSCRKSAPVSLSNCKWTSEINDWQETIRFMCPRNKVMAGLKSRHDNSKEDRRWKVMCCEAKGYHTEGCLMTRKLNQYKEAFSYQADKSSSGTAVLVGMESDFKRQYNDRRWQLTECNLVKDGSKDRRNKVGKDKDEEKSCKDDKEREEDHKDRSRDKSGKRDDGCGCGDRDDKSRDKSREKKEQTPPKCRGGCPGKKLRQKMI